VLVILLVEETRVHRETTDLPKVTDKLYHIMLYILPSVGFELTPLLVIGTDCINSCNSNYHSITASAVPGDNIYEALIRLGYIVVMGLTSFHLIKPKRTY